MIIPGINRLGIVYESISVGNTLAPKKIKRTSFLRFRD